MNGAAIAFLVLSMVILWGGLLTSTVFLARRPDVATFPPGGEDDGHDGGIVIHDT